MPSQHLDKSSRRNLETNLRQSRRHNQDVPPWKYYETSADDPRPIADPELEYETDKSGRIHQRKGRSENIVAEGYGSTNFGVSSFEPKPNQSKGTLIAGAGLSLAGALGWKFRSELKTGANVLMNYALLSYYSFKAND